MGIGDVDDRQFNRDRSICHVDYGVDTKPTQVMGVCMRFENVEWSELGSCLGDSEII
jgi:hypothetical protein